MTIIIAVLTLLAWLLVPQTALATSPDMFAHGQWWRLFTAHMSHWTPAHLGWDLFAFVILGLLIEKRSRRLFIGTLIAAAIAIPLTAGVDVYRGLSGVDSALFVLAATLLLREKIAERQWRWVGVFAGCLVAFAAKVTVELATGATLFATDLGAQVVTVPSAHGCGALIGLIGGLLATIPRGPLLAQRDVDRAAHPPPLRAAPPPTP